MVIDSAENCHYDLGILVYGGLGDALLLRPTNPVPVDRFVATTELHLYVEAVTDPHPFSPGETPEGNGVVFDASSGPFVWNSFATCEVSNLTTCVEVIGSTPPAGSTPASFENNELTIMHLHGNRAGSTLLSLSDGCVGNDIRVQATGADQGAAGVTAVEVRGMRNQIVVKPRPANGPFAPGRTIVFDSSAEDNRVYLIPYGSYDVASVVTDGAAVPTNQLITPLAQPPVTVTLNSGEVYTQRLFPAFVSALHPTEMILVRQGTSTGTESADIPPGSWCRDVRWRHDKREEQRCCDTDGSADSDHISVRCCISAVAL